MNELHLLEHLIQQELAENLDGKLITSEKSDQKYTKTKTKLETKFPEKIIGCKNIGKHIVTVTSRNALTIRNSSSLRVEKMLQCDYFATSICSLILGEDVDNLRIFFGSVIGDLIDWKPSEEKPVKRVGHKGMIFSIASVDESSKLFTISDDRTIRMWNLEDRYGPPICTTYGHTARPYAICIDPFHHLIYTGGIEQTLFCWKYTDTDIKLLRKTVLSIGVIRQITQHDDTQLVISSQDGAVLEYDTSLEPELFLADNILNFAHIQDNLAVLSADSGLIVYEDDSMSRILVRCEGIKHMNAGEESMVAWSLNSMVFFNAAHFLRLKLSINIVTATCYKNYVAVKTIDGFIQIFNLEGRIECLKKFRPQNAAMLPSVFAVIGDILVMGTTHGELLHGRLGDDSKIIHSLPRHSLFQIFGGKEVTCIRPIPDTNSFMTLAKIGTWTTMSLELPEPTVHILNIRTFSAKSRIAWPSKFIEINGELVIVGFFGTSVIMWNATNGYPLFDAYCGGGHRAWELRASSLDSRMLYFDFTRDNQLFRQNISIAQKAYAKTAAHSSPIVSAAGSSHFLVTVSLDGHLSIGDEQGGALLTMFVGENLLCTDILEQEEGASSFVTSGGGNGKLSVWKFKKDDLLNHTFRLSHISRPDEGRIVDTKIINLSGKFYFLTSFSSGKLEVFNELLESVEIVELEDRLGIGSRLGSLGNEVFVGTSGSYLLAYRMGDDGGLEERKEVKLLDRSGVTSIVSTPNRHVIIGCDSGHVFRWIPEEPDAFVKIHSHLSTVVGIVPMSNKICSVSLDCAVLTSSDSLESSEDTVSRKPTIIDMPGGMVKSGDHLVIVGDGIQLVKNI